MKKLIQFVLLLLLQLCCATNSCAQEQVTTDPDLEMKDNLYKKYKNEVRAFSHKDFDEFFMEFFSKQNQEQALSKEEYYTYTIKIAIYSEKLGLLYKNQKDVAQKSKKEWFEKRYSDYLSNRPKNKP